MHKRKADPIERQSIDPSEDRIEQLKRLFPEAVNEDGIDVDALVNLLGKREERRRERYNFTWAGKQDAFLSLGKRSQAALKPVPEESLNWDSTGHLFIEGDNLEALKLLYKSYFGRVKMIYIDPPYNTGKDFVYPDNYAEPLTNYLRLTGQADEDGNIQTTHADKSGRWHSNWLSMMYPRLFLACQLLREDGVIFVSIDDNEVHNLRMLMNQVFGEENFCGTFIWERKKKPSFLDRNMGTVTEYIVAYAKSLQLSPPFVAGVVEDGKKYPFNNADNPTRILRFPSGSVRFSLGDQIVKAQDMSSQSIITALLDDVKIIDGINANEFRLKGAWRYSQSKVDEFVALGDEISISRIPFRPNYVNRSGNMKKTINLLSHRVNGIPTNEDATSELRMIFGADVISYPKPTGLLKYLVRAVSSNNDIILDFFAGSATTAHAVLAQNREDAAARKFIMVQLPEVLYDSKNEQKIAYNFCVENNLKPTLAEISKERIRRVIQRMKPESLPNEDLGFRVFRLGKSSMRQWQDLPAETSAADYDKQMALFIADPLLDGWTARDVIAEVAVKEAGFSLTYRIERVQAVAEQTVCKVIDDEKEQHFYICLDDKISFEALKPLELTRDDLFIFRDSAINDTIVANLALACRIKSI